MMNICTQNVVILQVGMTLWRIIQCMIAASILTLYSPSAHYGCSVHRREAVSQCWGPAVFAWSPWGYTPPPWWGTSSHLSRHQWWPHCLAAVLHTHNCKCNDDDPRLTIMLYLQGVFIKCYCYSGARTPQNRWYVCKMISLGFGVISLTFFLPPPETKLFVIISKRRE